MERMPHQLYVEFEGIEKGSGFDCVAHGEFVVIMIKGCWDKAALLYDVCKRTWQWIPPCPYIVGSNDDDGEDQVVLHGFAYDPRLATPVTGLIHQLSSLPFQNFNAN